MRLPNPDAVAALSSPAPSAAASSCSTITVRCARSRRRRWQNRRGCIRCATRISTTSWGRRKRCGATPPIRTRRTVRCSRTASAGLPRRTPKWRSRSRTTKGRGVRIDLTGEWLTPGLHRTAWDLRRDPPPGAAAAGGRGGGRGGNAAPSVPAARYTAAIGTVTGDAFTPAGRPVSFLVVPLSR